MKVSASFPHLEASNFRWFWSSQLIQHKIVKKQTIYSPKRLMTPTIWPPGREGQTRSASWFSRCTSSSDNRTDHLFSLKSYRVCTESVEELAALRHMEKGPWALRIFFLLHWENFWLASINLNSSLPAAVLNTECVPGKSTNPLKEVVSPQLKNPHWSPQGTQPIPPSCTWSCSDLWLFVLAVSSSPGWSPIY